MQQGTIASLRNGFGFIKREGVEKELFFHMSDLVGVQFDDLREGDKVSFEEGTSDKGPKATNVTKI